MRNNNNKNNNNNNNNNNNKNNNKNNNNNNNNKNNNNRKGVKNSKHTCCGICKNCKDKPCFGGKNIRKKSCLNMQVGSFYALEILSKIAGVILELDNCEESDNFEVSEKIIENYLLGIY